jgi:hypothetical protein
MARKIDKIYSERKVTKIIIAGEEKAVERPVETKVAEVKFEEGLEKEKVVEIFVKIPTITKNKAIALYDAGIKSLRELALAPTEKILAIKEITMENVKAIKNELKGIYEEVRTGIAPAEKKLALGPGLKKAGEKILTATKTVGGKIVSVSKKSLAYVKKGAGAAKTKLKATYKKVTAPEEIPKPKKVVEKRAKAKRKAKRKTSRRH